MKFEQVKGWKMAGKMAAVVALGALASAQSAQSARGEGEVRKGQAFEEVSLENDIRIPAPARRKIVLERPAEQRRLELVFKMRARPDADLRAFMPSADDMEMTIMLVHGTPGGMALIHLDTRAPEVRRAGGIKIAGQFDEDGRFSVRLPEGFQADDIFVHGEDRGLVNLRGGGHKVPASKRPVTDEMDVEATIDQAYQGWARFYAEHYTNLQFRSGGMRGARLADPDITVFQSSSSGGLSSGAGHTQPGSSVDDDVTSGAGEEEVFIDLPNPVGGSRAFGKIALERPRKPALGGGHVRPGTSVENDTQIGDAEEVEEEDLPNPVGGSRAFGKIKLERPAPKPTPAQRDDHVRQRKL